MTFTHNFNKRLTGVKLTSNTTDLKFVKSDIFIIWKAHKETFEDVSNVMTEDESYQKNKDGSDDYL